MISQYDVPWYAGQQFLRVRSFGVWYSALPCHLSLCSILSSVALGAVVSDPLKPCAPTLIPLLFCGTRFSFSFATVAESSARSLFARCRLPRMQSEARGVTALHTEMPCESVLTEVHSAQRSLVFDDVEVFALVTNQDLSTRGPRRCGTLLPLVILVLVRLHVQADVMTDEGKSLFA